MCVVLTDPRRAVPSTDRLLADPRLEAAEARLGRATVRTTIHAAQDMARRGDLEPAAVLDHVLATLPVASTSMRPVINGTGVVLHTNLGRAPLSAAARQALLAASGYVDVEFDLDTGERARRGRGALAALKAALPEAGGVLVVNNGAAALLLAVTALAPGREVIWSRGEMLEIGDGFRLPELLASAGARIREVGTTNRTAIADYAGAVGSETGCILKVHPSNFRVSGFSASVGVRELAGLGPPVVVDAGSGLLRSDPLLPGELDMAGALRDGAAVVTGSADKLLGGPQAGIVAGNADILERLRRHPMARALRVDKLTLAALEATVSGPETPVRRALRADVAELQARAKRMAQRIGNPASAAPCHSAVGGGSSPGLLLESWAVSLPSRLAAPLRRGSPAVVGRIERDRCLLDLRCVAEEDDDAVVAAVTACM